MEENGFDVAERTRVFAEVALEALYFSRSFIESLSVQLGVKILVTGSSGFIGQICSKRLSLDNEIYNLDLVDSGQGAFQKTDITSFYEVEKLFLSIKPDLIVHLAALSNIPESYTNPLLCYATNVDGTRNILECMKAVGTRKIIFASSAAVYSESNQPILESDKLGPISPYAISKVKAESLISAYGLEHNIKYSILRFFNACGADIVNNLGENHEPETHVIPNIIKAMKDNKPFYVNGNDHDTNDGTCVRDYVHVLDIVRAIQYSIEYMDENESNVFNVGSGIGVSIKDLLELSNNRNDVHYKPKRDGDTPTLIANIQKAKAHMGWRPVFGIQDIIRDTKKFFGLV